MMRQPRLVSGRDLKSLPLTPADAFLLSRVDATLTEQDLAIVTGLPPEQVASMLDRLEALGVIAFPSVGSSHTRLRAASAMDVAAEDPRRTPAAAPEALAARRQAFARRLSGTHAAAGTPVTPPRRVTEPDPENARRTAEAMQAHRERAMTEARRTEVMRLLDEGSSLLDRKDFTASINAYRMAASLAPEDRAVQATCDEAVQHARDALANVHWEQAVLDEREERWEDAALGFARVCAARPNDAPAHERVAVAALRAGNVRRAVEYARKAIELAPRSAMHRITLARAYVAAGFDTSATSELQRALDLAPGDARIQNLASRVQAFVGKKAGKVG